MAIFACFIHEIRSCLSYSQIRFSECRRGISSRPRLVVLDNRETRSKRKKRKISPDYFYPASRFIDALPQNEYYRVLLELFTSKIRTSNLERCNTVSVFISSSAKCVSASHQTMPISQRACISGGGKVYRIYLGGSIGEIFPELGRARESARPQRRIASTSIITVIARCITMPWWLWLSPRDTCIVNTRLAALYDRRRCKVKCAWLRSALVYGICTSISMFRSYSRGGEGGGAALERTKRSANSQLASCCGSAYKDG